MLPSDPVAGVVKKCRRPGNPPRDGSAAKILQLLADGRPFRRYPPIKVPPAYHFSQIAIPLQSKNRAVERGAILGAVSFTRDASARNHVSKMGCTGTMRPELPAQKSASGQQYCLISIIWLHLIQRKKCASTARVTPQLVAHEVQDRTNAKHSTNYHLRLILFIFLTQPQLTTLLPFALSKSGMTLIIEKIDRLRYEDTCRFC